MNEQLYQSAPIKMARKMIRFGMQALPDKIFLKIKYRALLGRPLNLAKPETYNEKLQWLKLYNRRPEYTQMVDKYAVRQLVAEKIGEEYLIPLLGVWDSFDDIDFDALPNRFVLKPTHTSGDVYICKGKSQLDYKKLSDLIQGWLKRKYERLHREWPYKNVPPRIIAERYMQDHMDKGGAAAGLTDYKFYCFDGKPKAMLIVTDRQVNTKMDFYDMDFNHLPLVWDYENSDRKLEKPVNFERMKELAKVLAWNIPHVRVDFYESDGRVYFGELTFYPVSGWGTFEPPEWDRIFGDWLTLPPPYTEQARR